jgi:hypothetical protein
LTFERCCEAPEEEEEEEEDCKKVLYLLFKMSFSLSLLSSLIAFGWAKTLLFLTHHNSPCLKTSDASEHEDFHISHTTFSAICT